MAEELVITCFYIRPSIDLNAPIFASNTYLSFDFYLLTSNREQDVAQIDLEVEQLEVSFF